MHQVVRLQQVRGRLTAPELHHPQTITARSHIPAGREGPADENCLYTNHYLYYMASPHLILTFSDSQAARQLAWKRWRSRCEGTAPWPSRLVRARSLHAGR